MFYLKFDDWKPPTMHWNTLCTLFRLVVQKYLYLFIILVKNCLNLNKRPIEYYNYMILHFYWLIQINLSLTYFSFSLGWKNWKCKKSSFSCSIVLDDRRKKKKCILFFTQATVLYFDNSNSHSDMGIEIVWLIMALLTVSSSEDLVGNCKLWSVSVTKWVWQVMSGVNELGVGVSKPKILLNLNPFPRLQHHCNAMGFISKLSSLELRQNKWPTRKKRLICFD